MSIGIAKLFEDVEALIDRGRLVPAIETLELARRLTKIPQRGVFATYNAGVIQWHLLGDGERARGEFLAAVASFETHGERLKLGTLHANVLENAMLCALSFDEFERLAAKLEALAPGIPILTGLVPEMRAARERGEPWSNRLFAIAGSYYNRNDPKRDVGRYGEARSTYHLLLTHRRELRLSREDWRMAVSELCVLSMRMASDCAKTRGGDRDMHSPEEFLPILTSAVPLADEYLAANSGDEMVAKFRQDMGSMLAAYRNRWAALQGRPSGVEGPPSLGALLVMLALIALAIWWFLR